MNAARHNWHRKTFFLLLYPFRKLGAANGLKLNDFIYLNLTLQSSRDESTDISTALHCSVKLIKLQKKQQQKSFWMPKCHDMASFIILIKSWLLNFKLLGENFIRGINSILCENTISRRCANSTLLVSIHRMVFETPVQRIKINLIRLRSLTGHFGFRMHENVLTLLFFCQFQIINRY